MNKKTCDCCGAPLPPRGQRYCSDQCMRHETNARRRVGAPKRKIQKEQLCWTCAKACGGVFLEPVVCAGQGVDGGAQQELQRRIQDKEMPGVCEGMRSST